MKRPSRLPYAPLAILAFAWMWPILWTAVTSLKPAEGGGALVPTILFRPTLDNYVLLFTERGFAVNLRNSFLLAGGATAISVFLACLAAFPLARSTMAGRGRISMWILSLRMLPPISLVVPFYMMLSRTGFLDTYAGMLVVYMSFSLPFAVWMLIGFFSEVPRSIDEAAAADGATPLQTLFRFIVPISRGGVAVTTIFTFVFAWNEFLFAFLLTKERWVTVPVSLGSTITPFQTDWGFLSSGAVTSFLPLVIFVFLLQRQMVRGVTLGAVR
jgi:ABC-type glycerol-3-phosphate transport system permease component